MRIPRLALGAALVASGCSVERGVAPRAPSPAPQATYEVAAKSGGPMIFVNGVRVPEGDMKKLNTADIESVEVVKGQAAVDKYGKEASAGVIVITLKPVKQ